MLRQVGIKGVRAQSGRRTLAVKRKSQGIDLRHISENLGGESLEAVKKLCEGDPPRRREIARRIL